MKTIKMFCASLSILAVIVAFTFAGCKKEETPPASTELKVGSSHLGGKIAYILQATDSDYVAGQMHGLIVAPSDQSTSAQFGCINIVTGAQQTDWGTGNSNTTKIITTCTTAGIAAKLCADLVIGSYSDWYLPSRDELNKIYLNKSAIGGLSDNTYWSSSEKSGVGAYQQFFLSGAQSVADKNGLKCVRAVRTF